MVKFCILSHTIYYMLYYLILIEHLRIIQLATEYLVYIAASKSVKNQSPHFQLERIIGYFSEIPTKSTQRQ